MEIKKLADIIEDLQAIRKFVNDHELQLENIAEILDAAVERIQTNTLLLQSLRQRSLFFLTAAERKLLQQVYSYAVPLTVTLAQQHNVPEADLPSMREENEEWLRKSRVLQLERLNEDDLNLVIDVLSVLDLVSRLDTDIEPLQWFQEEEETIGVSNLLQKISEYYEYLQSIEEEPQD